MKKKLLILIIFAVLGKTYSQNFRLGGNGQLPIGDAINFTNNYLGSAGGPALNNVPLRIGTFGQQRIFIAQTNASGVPSSLGNVGIGNQFFGGVGGINPYSNLHIQQDNGNFNFGGGIRPWMSTIGTSTGNAANGWNSAGTGVLISNGDNIWLGLKNKGAFDLNDAILNWGDNGGAQTPFTDYFRFTFTHYGTGFLGSANDGLEIMRLAPNSFVGVGDFNINNIVQPTSKLHIHENTSLHTGGAQQSVWMQMTNTDFAPNPTANNGLRIGLLYQNAGQRTGNAFIYNQENRHLIFSTNHVTPDGNGAINNTLERMRITSIGAPTTLPTGYGVYNPGNINNTDLTRVAISHDPSNPVYRPLSLLHLGYSTNTAATPTELGGWRSWMDVGTFTNQNFGALGGMSMYSGLKVNPFPNAAGEAIISWGYTPSNAVGFPIPTRMRVLFTTATTGTTTAAGGNGIEAAQFWSDGNNTRMGVGNMQTAGVDPQNTLEIRSSTSSPYFTTPGGFGSSGLRFKFLNSTNNPVPNGLNGVDNTKLLTVDKNGDVVITNVSAGVSNADNGLSIDGPTTNLIHLGQTYTGAPAFTGLGSLLDDREIPLNGFDLVFSGIANPSKNRVSIGSAPFPGNDQTTYIDAAAKLSVQNFTEPGGAHFQTLPLLFASVPNMYYGAKGTVLAQHPDKKIYGLYGQALTTGATFKGIGVFGEAIGSGLNIGVYGKALGGLNPLAGFFDGDVYVNAGINSGTGYLTASDQNYKTNIDSISDALYIINQLKPKEFYYDTTNVANIRFSSKKQFGFIAQEVETVLPNLVGITTKPSDFDTLGNIIPGATYKTLNYQGFEAINTKAIQELSRKNNQKDSLIGDLQNQINQLATLINSCCQNTNTRTQTTTSNTVIDVELSDKDIIVLNQNVPNPFAEQTTIAYNVPEKSGFAQIIFNDMKGQIIKVVDIKTKGKGQLNVFANDLSTGMYTYSLYVDGKLIDTKKMVKTE
jgi:hypothetical protein